VRLAWILLAIFGCSGPDGDDADATAAPAAVTSTPPVPSPGAAAVHAPPRAEHSLFSLVDNRHAAHRYVDGDLVLDAADVGFARYTRFSIPVPRWKLGQIVEQVRCATASGWAPIEVPLDGALATGIDRVIVRVFGRAKQTIALRINGKRPTASTKTSRVTLVDGWQTVTLPVEPGRFTVGENQLVVEHEARGGKAEFAVEWVRLSRGHADTDDPRAAIAFDPASNTITLARDATLVWYVTMPDSAHLVGEVVGECRVLVKAMGNDETFAGGVLGAESSRVDLTRMSGRVVGMTLTAADCPTVKLVAPEVMARGPAPYTLPRAEPPKFVVLWIMDALRADKIPIFTPGARARTPNLDELAKTSTIFRQYYVQGNESQTSHSSMWTGLYPAVHNVRLAGRGGTWRIENRFETLAEKLAAAGFYTAAVTGNGFVNEDGGYTRGFKHFRNMMRESGIENGVIYGDKIVGVALAKLETMRDKPGYMFMGTIDTHSPWIARRPWIDLYSSPTYRGPFKEFAGAEDLGFRPGSMGCAIIPPRPEIDRLLAIYDSAISYQDKQLGRFIDQLKSWGIWERTMLVITADHGDEFFEDGRCGHGGSLRDSLVRVPLLIHDPERFPPGVIVEEGVEGVDVMPSVLDAVGIAQPEQIQGESLAVLAQSTGRGWARASYASMYEYAHAMRVGRWKLRVGPSGVPLVNDLVGDPDEKIDVSRTHLVERRMLTDNLGLFLALRAQWKKATWGSPTSVTRVGAAALDRLVTP
jgi:choline-sulfatase